MIKHILFFLILTIFYSCGSIQKNESLPDISQANNIKFYFKSDFDSTGKIKIISKEITEAERVSQIKDLIDYDPFTYVYCTSTGSMSFCKDSVQIISMVFNTTPDQKHIAFNYNGKLIAIKLSDANAGFLESLKN